MASIFRRDSKKRGPYLIEYTDYDGKRKTVKGPSDKGLAQQLAATLENEALLRKRGIIDPTQEHFAKQKTTPLEGHLKAFEESLAKRSPTHIKKTVNRVRRIVSGCEFNSLGEIDGERVQACLREIAESDDLGNRTYNHYVQAFNSFCNWAVKTKRLIANPIVGIERLNNEVDVRHQRRALTTDEVRQLVEAARASKKNVQGYTGEMRARVYLTSYFSGLRQSEIASLTPSSFRLADPQPTITVDAACSKHRKKDVLPIHPELVALVSEWVKGLSADAPLFPKFAKKKAWLMVKKDLERVGIAYETSDGIADFHAAGRHSYVTGLLRNGTSITDAKELARHTDVRMTMKYTHVGLPDQAKALAALPSPGGELQYIYSVSNGLTGPNETLPVIDCQSEPVAQETLNPGGDRGYGVDCQSPSSGVKPDNGWRRGELNPRPEMFPRRRLHVYTSD